jgi:uncharacterized protein
LDELGERAVAVLASSPAYPESEQGEARALARSLGARLIEVNTSELELEAYTRNHPDRCFHCKEELFDTLEPIQHDLHLAHLAYGATADDAGDHRPGHGSAVRRGVRFPLLEAGMGKSDIRAAARALRQIEAAEQALKVIGFRQVRVRHHGDVARIEVDPAEISRVVEERELVVEALRGAGYKFVSVDLEGYSTGSLNRVWKTGQ